MTQATKLACRGLWKLFGPQSAQLLQRHDGAPSLEQLAAAGAIGAVRDVSFEVRSGEILMVMGLSGSGKSTLIRCLTRLIEPSAGQVLFDDQDLLAATESDLIELRRHKMGMVFQHFGLLPHRTVLENVAFPLEIQGVDKHDRLERAREMVRTVGLEGREAYYPRELSGGQQQRVGIARSLAVEPEVWFLDEPFSALDPLIRREMQDEFLRLQRLLHKTIVFITHDFDEAIRLGDRIAVMRDGAIIQIDTPEALVSRPADDYVAQFTRDAPRGKLISVAAIMDAVSEDLDLAHDGNGVLTTDKLDHVAPRVLTSERPLPVRDAGGRTVGLVDRGRLIESLFDARA